MTKHMKDGYATMIKLQKERKNAINDALKEVENEAIKLAKILKRDGFTMGFITLPELNGIISKIKNAL